MACGTITAITGTTLTVNLGSTTIGPVGLNSDVVAIPAHVYLLNPASAGVPAQLFRDGVLLASDVEDFQVTYFFDLDDDLVVDAGESFGAAGGTAQPWELTPANTRPDPSSLREVQVNVVTVTRDDDPNRDWSLGAGQVTGNRTAAQSFGRRRQATARVFGTGATAQRALVGDVRERSHSSAYGSQARVRAQRCSSRCCCSRCSA